MKVQLSDLTLKPLTPEDGAQFTSDFDCGDSDLNEFLREDAHKYQEAHLSFTRVVFLGDELLGYITLLTDSIGLKTGEKRKLVEFHQLVRQWPAIKIGRLAVCSQRQKRDGVGRALIKYAVGVAIRTGIDAGVGCRFITVDAYPKSVGFYEKCGFKFNKIQPEAGASTGVAVEEEKSSTFSMRYDIILDQQL